MMLMHNPPHPAPILRALRLEPLGLSVSEAAKPVGLSRKTLSSPLNGGTGISPNMTIRLSSAFDASAENWLGQQMQYALSHAEQRRGELNVKKPSAANPCRAPNGS
jgi:addiction module HigA family antidote